MTFVETENINSGSKVFILTISISDYVKARFDNFDEALLRECKREDATIADKLLALEMVARRIEEEEK